MSTDTGGDADTEPLAILTPLPVDTSWAAAPSAPTPAPAPPNPPAAEQPWWQTAPEQPATAAPAQQAPDFSSWATEEEQKPKWPLIVGAVAAVAAVVVGGIVIATRPDTDSTPEASPESSAPTSTRDTSAENRLLGILPAGYAPSACKAVTPAKDALAQVDCGPNDDPGGPHSATFTLMRDKTALKAAFDNQVKSHSIVVCPNKIQSPGAWRHTATPDQIAGTVYCGLTQGHPVVGWTDETRLTLSETRSSGDGPPLDQLFQWWSIHS